MYNHEQCVKRAEALVSQMTLSEKASQLTYNSPAVPRLNIPAYNWWNEGLHGVARSGTATSFPQAIGMAAAFSRELMQAEGDIVAEEGRAKYNENVRHADRDIYKGLTFWSPNINIFRDPRWGRGQETLGEDPYLTGELGKSFVQGLQGKGPVMKAAACAKHFAVHSGPEALRHEFDAVVSEKDLHETYLAAFEKLVKEADVAAVMGAYNRTDGEPCCGSYKLLKDILRDQWGFKGHVVSDCWAVKDFHLHHKVTGSPEESAALALKAGCDLNCGDTYLMLNRAFKQGLISEEDITRAAVRLFTTRFELGLFDGSEFDRIPYEKVECPSHLAKALEAARKSIVLLKNDGILPLKKDQLHTIAVIGPNADSRAALIGNYYGTSSHYITALEGIQAEAGKNIRVLYAQGCELEADRTEALAMAHDRLAEAVTAAEHSDAVILCLGLDETLEGEERDEGNHYGSGDKKDLELPLVQKQLLEAVTKTGKPVIVCLFAGSAINLSWADEHCRAILLPWYPGAQGGKALAEILFGKISPSGKLPVTFYRSLEGIGDFSDYSMKNRTYRYYSGTPLYPFGYGLTYGRVVCQELEMADLPDPESGIIPLRVYLENQSDVPTEDVLQIYIHCEDSSLDVPNWSLCGFQRIKMGAHEKTEKELQLMPQAFTLIDEQGRRILDGSEFEIWVGTSQPDEHSTALSGSKTVKIEIKVD